MRTIARFVLILAACGLAAGSASAQTCPDADGDGSKSAACAGGDDCDDRDPRRFPGNVEVCDAEQLDEDCDPTTFGFRDDDHDGVVDARCCNLDGAGRPLCGADCDDSNAAIRPASQVCNGANVVLCEKGVFEPAACLAGTTCLPQPNGTGVCAVAPAGYEVPPPFVKPEPRPLPSYKVPQTQIRVQPSVKKLKVPPKKDGTKPESP